MQSQSLPSRDRLSADIRIVMTVGVGRPYRAEGTTTPHLDSVARDIVSDPSLLSYALCGAAIEQVVFGLGDSDYGEAIRAAFRISDKAKPLTMLKDRSKLAAEKLGRKSVALEEKDLQRMCGVLATAMLELAVERRAPLPTMQPRDDDSSPVSVADPPGDEPSSDPGTAPNAPIDNSPPRQGPQQLRRKVVAASLVALLVGLAALLIDRPGSRTTPTAAPSLSQLRKEAAQHLTGSTAPSPEKRMTAKLGFGDPIQGGRPIYRENSRGFTPSSTPTFDSIINARYGIGDERRFLRVETSLATDAQQLWQLPGKHVVEVRPNEVVWVIVRVDNNAANTPRCALTGPYVATDTRLRVAIWNSNDDHLHIIRAWLTAKNTHPVWITDAVAVLAPNVTTLEPDSSISREYSKLSPQFHTNPTINIESLLLYPGMLIGNDGLVGSCWNNRYYLALGFRQR